MIGTITQAQSVGGNDPIYALTAQGELLAAQGCSEPCMEGQESKDRMSPGMAIQVPGSSLRSPALGPLDKYPS